MMFIISFRLCHTPKNSNVWKEVDLNPLPALDTEAKYCYKGGPEFADCNRGRKDINGIKYKKYLH